jgi:hypothetical protein
MGMRAVSRFLFTLALAVSCALPAGRAGAQSSGDCAQVAMQVSAARSYDPGFEGLWKYTVTGAWDVTRYDLGHIDFFLGLANLECICDPRVIKFPTPAGTSDGMSASGPCTAIYYGQYLCKGDPAIPEELRTPTVKFEPNETIGCEPGVKGSGTWVFYSPFAPAPFSVYPDAVAIKHGRGTCTGDLVGTMPMGDCTVPTRAATWGGVKAIYR